MSLQLEIRALRHQLTVYQRSIRRPRVRPSDRIFWSGLARRWARWREGVVFGHPATVLAWQCTRFRAHGARLRRTRRGGRPAVSQDLRKLIREIFTVILRWDSPRLSGEWRKLGSAVAKSTVEKYRVRRRPLPAPTWRAFLKNHLAERVSIDFFPVPTVRCTVRFVLVVLAHARRRVVHVNGTAHPTAQWTAQQLVEAFPRETAPRYLVRDRHAVYGDGLQRRLTSLGMDQILAAPRSP